VGGGHLDFQGRVYSLFLMSLLRRAACDDMGRFSDFALRAGTAAIADPRSRITQVGTDLTPDVVWLGLLLFHGPEPKILDGGCRIQCHPWVASVAMLRGWLHATEGRAGASGDGQSKAKGKRRRSTNRGGAAKLWLTVSEAATASGIPAATISQLATAGKLKSNGRKRRKRQINSADLNRYLLGKKERKESPKAIQGKLTNAQQPHK
jgi:hypothetical protein